MLPLVFHYVLYNDIRISCPRTPRFKLLSWFNTSHGEEVLDIDVMEAVEFTVFQLRSVSPEEMGRA